MNYRLVMKYLGIFSAGMSVLFAPSMLWSVYFAEWSVLLDFLKAGIICLLLGAVLFLIGRKANSKLFEREALAMVGVGWLLLPCLGGLPFWVGGQMTFVDAYFESMSGFATCGASILSNIEILPKGLLFWRSFTIWLGGMGIILLFLAVLPYLGAGGKVLAKSESSGHNAQGFSPRIRDTARILYRVYFGITIVLTLLLYIAGMSLFDALCHTFATLGTGGYSTYNASVGHFDSVSIELIIIAGMLISGTSFALLFAAARGDWRSLFTNLEWRVYMGLFVLCTAVITLNLVGVKGNIPESVNPAEPIYSWGHAMRVAAFQVASCQTCTGFITDNFENWPHLSKFILVLLMLIGGCAGSTSGGMKVVRFIILAKMTYWSVEHTFRPKTVRPVRLGGIVISDEIQRSIYAFFVLQIFIIAIGTLLLCAVGLPILSSVTAVITAQSGVGPGLELVGAVQNFGFIPDFGKIVLVVIMAIGRVELFSICAMLIPAFWKHS